MLLGFYFSCLLLIAPFFDIDTVVAAIQALPDLYLETLIGVLTGESLQTDSWDSYNERALPYMQTAAERATGRTQCLNCFTMIGSKRLPPPFKLDIYIYIYIYTFISIA